MLGLVIGGVVNDFYGWRIALMLVGVPGVAMALLLPVVLREPRLMGLIAEASAAADHPALPLRTALVQIFASRGYVYLLVAASVAAFLSYGKGLWTISLFIRSHGLSTTEVGVAGAIVLGLGPLLFGILSDALLPYAGVDSVRWGCLAQHGWD